MKIMFINNDGGGFADVIEVKDGLTTSELFEQQMKGASPEHFLIRVNRQPATADQVLQDGDRVTFTPTKIEGARTDARRCPVVLERERRSTDGTRSTTRPGCALAA